MTSLLLQLVTISARGRRYFAACVQHLPVAVYHGTRLSPHPNLVTWTGCSILIERAKRAQEVK